MCRVSDRQQRRNVQDAIRRLQTIDGEEKRGNFQKDANDAGEDFLDCSRSVAKLHFKFYAQKASLN